MLRLCMYPKDRPGNLKPRLYLGSKQQSTVVEIPNRDLLGMFLVLTCQTAVGLPIIDASCYGARKY